jgi:hypothetical protein
MSRHNRDAVKRKGDRLIWVVIVVERVYIQSLSYHLFNNLLTEHVLVLVILQVVC